MSHALDTTGVTQSGTIELVRASSGDNDNIWFQVVGSSIDTAQLKNAGVTLAKMANLAANKLIGSIAGGTPEAIDCTAAGRALLDDADATAQLTTLGGGAAPVGTGAVVLATGLPTQWTNELSQDAIGLILADTATIDVTYNDAGDVLSWAIVAGSVNTTQLADAGVTLAKMANLAQDQFIIRTTASTGVPETATCTAAARTVLDDTTVSAMVDTLGGAAATGTGALVRKDAPTFTTSITVPNTGLKVMDTDASHALSIVPGSNITAARTLTLTTGDADRTLTLSGNATLSGGTHSGTNTGDQFTAMTTDRLLGRDTAGSGAAEEISVGAGLEFTGGTAIGIANDGVTNARLANMTASTFKMRVTGSTGDPEDGTVVQANQILAAVTGFAYNANTTLDLNTALNWQLTNTLTGDIALTLSNGADGYNGTVAFKQDGTGGRKITGITVSGRTVLMDKGLGASLNTTDFKAANAYSLLGFEYKTVNSTAIVFITLVVGASAAYG